MTTIDVLASTERIELNSIRMEYNNMVWVHFGHFRNFIDGMLTKKGPLWLLSNHSVETAKFTGFTLFDILCI